MVFLFSTTLRSNTKHNLLSFYLTIFSSSSSSLSTMATTLCHVNPTLHAASRHDHRRPKACCGAMRVSMAHNQPYWASISEQIDAHLKKVVTVKYPVSVFEPMHHLVFAAPRNMAPALCVAACELVGGQPDQAMTTAAALHVMHAASFTHEQLRLSDRPSLMPRFRPTAHHVFGPNIELLTGDGMVPFGFELVAKSDDPAQNNSGRILRVIIEITRAIGSQGVINGQYSELRCSQSNDDDLITHTCEKKEGALHACGATCGAILGGGSEEEIERLRRYGLYVGTIQGLLQRSMLSPRKRSIRVDEYRNLALKELEGFDEAKVEEISSFVDVNLSLV